MAANVIILTAGIAGSSVLTRLLADAGYWSGDASVKKADYDTHENAELVRLNKQLLDAAGIGERYAMCFRADYTARVLALTEAPGALDLTPFRRFLAHCRRHRPWVWKDPRLWITLPLWLRLLAESGERPAATLRLLLIHREDWQEWISCTHRRQIQTYAYLRRYNAATLATMRALARDHNLRCCELTFEQLICEPETTLARVGRHLGRPVDVARLRAVYRGTLGRRVHGFRQAALAILIYLKNYPQRYR